MSISRIRLLDRRNLHCDYTHCLGAGGFGQVFKGTYYDQGVHKDVAIKVLKENARLGKSQKETFERETSMASQLNHPNIIRFYGICETMQVPRN